MKYLRERARNEGSTIPDSCAARSAASTGDRLRDLSRPAATGDDADFAGDWREVVRGVDATDVCREFHRSSRRWCSDAGSTLAAASSMASDRDTRGRAPVFPGLPMRPAATAEPEERKSLLNL